MEEGSECGGGRSIMDEFDDNILTEILLHLPMKMNIRCKAVCKRWLHLVSDPSFADRVLGTSSNHIPWCILYQYEHDNLTCPTDDDLRLRIASECNSDGSNSHTFMQNFLSWRSQKHRVFAAHNGLILCSDRSCSRWKRYVCNPITGKRVPLPETRNVIWELIGFIVSCKDGHTGFKVVRVTRHCQNNGRYTSEMSNFEVFSSDVGEWRDTGVALPETDGFGYYQGFNPVVHDGKIHWRAGTDTKSLIAYDPDKNECRVFSFNVPLSFGVRTGLIGTSCGHLCYANSVYYEDMLCVFVLENYEAQEWRPLVMTEMRIVLDLNHIKENERWNSMMPLAFHPSNKDIVYFEVRRNRGGRIVSLNLQTKELISLTGEEIPEGFNVRWPITLYEVPPWPTLVPQQIWEMISVHEERISVRDYGDDDLFDGFDNLFS